MTNGTTTISDEEAKILFEQTKSHDPLPFIPPALLNSSDIHAYATKTGMIAPYDGKYLKSSSYEVQIGNEIIYWDDNGEKNHLQISEGEKIILKPNSLMFFKTRQIFRLPDYIAVRFNLRITNVHRGLLLGTGPLVDPGFEGQILIPLHNLTTNSYTFKAGESLIWVEFTKVSPNSRWQHLQQNKYKDFIDFVEFPDNKKYIDPAKYLSKAAPHSPIKNAVPEAVAAAQRDAKSAKQRVKRIQWIGIVSIFIALAGAYYGLISPILSMVADTNAYLQSINAERRDYDRLLGKVGALEAEIARMRVEEAREGDDTAAEPQEADSPSQD